MNSRIKIVVILFRSTAAPKLLSYAMIRVKLFGLQSPLLSKSKKLKLTKIIISVTNNIPKLQPKRKRTNIRIADLLAILTNK